MSIAPTPTTNVDFPPHMLMKRWTVEEYHHMIQVGLFARDNRFELLEGWIVPKMPRNPPHEVSLTLGRRAVEARITPEWHLRVQSPITTSDSEPEPDVAVVRGDIRAYLARHPESTDIGLLIEVSDSTLAEDRQIKYRIYARAAVREHWIVNLVDSQIEVYTDPTGPSGAPSYRDRHEYKIGESVPLNIDGRVISTIPVKDLLP